MRVYTLISQISSSRRSARSMIPARCPTSPPDSPSLRSSLVLGTSAAARRRAGRRDDGAGQGRGRVPLAAGALRAPPCPPRAVVHGGEHRGADGQGAARARHRRHRKGRPDGRRRRAPQRAGTDGAPPHRHGRTAAEGDDRRRLRQHRGRQGPPGPRPAVDARLRTRRAHDQLHRRGADARGDARSLVGHGRLHRPARRRDRRRRQGDARRRALHALSRSPTSPSPSTATR